MSILQSDFYNRPTLTVARALLGARLLRMDGGTRLEGIITETEAYIGETDLACHAKAGRTRRTEAMYGPPGRAYVYFTYGMHWCFNAVTEAEGFPAAVLIRAISLVDSVETAEGLRVVAQRRAKAKRADWTNGPAKLTAAFAIDSKLNGMDLTTPENGLWIEAGQAVSDEFVTIGPRVGLYSVPEPWKSIAWRFLVKKPIFDTR